MTDHRILMNIIRSSCIGMWMFLAAAVQAQDGLADYNEDLSMYGNLRPAGAPSPQRGSSHVTVADVDETILDRRVMRDIVRDHRHRVVDQFGDYSEDFSGYSLGGELADDTAASSHAFFAEHGQSTLITIRTDDIGEREITRYITRLGGDESHTVTISSSNDAKGR
jgi:hypothetical protein